MSRKTTDKRRNGLYRLMDRHDGRCFWCDRPVAPARSYQVVMHEWHATRDHIIPRSQGGTNDLDNLVLACRACNQLRGDMPADLFLELTLRPPPCCGDDTTEEEPSDPDQSGEEPRPRPGDVAPGADPAPHGADRETGKSGVHDGGEP